MPGLQGKQFAGQDDLSIVTVERELEPPLSNIVSPADPRQKDPTLEEALGSPDNEGIFSLASCILHLASYILHHTS
jgi:hypothetical protein